MNILETALEKAIRLGGGSQSSLARLLGVAPQTVQVWVKNGKPSKEGCIAIEKAFGGAVTRAELDPETFSPHLYAGAALRRAA